MEGTRHLHSLHSFVDMLDMFVLHRLVLLLLVESSYGLVIVGARRFAAALVTQPVWVMNIVPVTEPDTLPIIYDRGFIGMYHDWCEPHSTYPRSYDLMHADQLLSTLTKK
jgi:hypothetical protein